MRKVLAALLVASSLSMTLTPVPARAENGNIAAGVIGGLAVGTLLGAAASSPRYYAPPPVYYAPPPRYYAPEPVYIQECYWTRGEPVFDRYRGAWFRPRVRVCD